MIILLVSCSVENPRRGGKTKAGRGIFGLNSGTYEKLLVEVNGYSQDDLSRPKDKEEIEYRVEYVKERSAQFTLTSGSICKYKYKKALIKEVVSKSGDDFNISKTTTPFEAVYSGIPIQDVKESCDAVKDSMLAGSPLSRKLDMEKAWSDYKELIKSEIQTLIKACEERGDILGGRCLSMNVSLTRELEVIFDSIIVYKLTAEIETPSQDYRVERMLSLNHPYFSHFGMIYKKGMAPLKGQNLSKAIDSLEVLSWKR